MMFPSTTDENQYENRRSSAMKNKNTIYFKIVNTTGKRGW